MSFLCLAFAVFNWVQGRDISANQFLVGLIIIQGCRVIPDEKSSRQWDHIKLLCILLSSAILIFALYGHFSDLQWHRPRSW